MVLRSLQEKRSGRTVAGRHPGAGIADDRWWDSGAGRHTPWGVRGRPISSFRGDLTGTHEPDLVGEDHGLDAVAQAELGEDAPDVGLDGRLADEQVRPAISALDSRAPPARAPRARASVSVVEPLPRPGRGVASGTAREVLDAGGG